MKRTFTKKSGEFIIKTLIVIEFFLLVNGQQQNGETCSNFDKSTPKVDCHPEPYANEFDCLARGCCWHYHENFQQAPFIGQPSCFYPNNFNCFEIVNSDEGQEVTGVARLPILPVKFSKATTSAEASSSSSSSKPRINSEELRWIIKRKESCKSSGFLNDANEIELKVNVYGNSLINIRITELDKDRFEPKLPEIKLPKNVNYNFSSKVNVENNNNNRKRLYLNNNNQKIYIELVNELDEQNKNKLTLLIVHGISEKILYEIDLSKMIYSEKFIQLPTYLPSDYIYGLGLHMSESLLKTSGNQYAKKYTMFNYGHPPEINGKSSYSSYPFYINLIQLNNNKNNNNSILNKETILDNFEEKRKLISIGCLMLNSNAMDILVHSNNNDDNIDSKSGITWRLVGGIVNLFLFLGPKPNDVIYQYQSLIGYPALPPTWALGYHQSRHNYNQLMSIKMAWARTRSNGIPMESFWTDLEYLKDLTSYTLNDLELNDLVKILQDNYDMHYVPIVDPVISLNHDINSYEALKLAKTMQLFATYETNNNNNNNSDTTTSNLEQIAIVTSWPKDSCALLDFTNPRIVDYLKVILNNYKKILNFNGLWLDMNEPEVFDNNHNDNSNNEEKSTTLAIDCSKLDNKQFNLLYKPGDRNLYDRTLCMSAKFNAGYHFNIHNLYSFYQSKAHFEALKELEQENFKRPFIISRSQFVGQSKYSGSWLGDLSSIFEHLRWSLIGIIESNLFGQPLIGADICGFFGQTNDELCSRWFSLGSFYPLARNHNDATSKDQDPGSMDEIVIFSARISLLKRYSLLPYFYSLFYDNYLNGEPVIRSILFEFFEKFYLIKNLDELPQTDDQFMLGSSIMFAPILYPKQEFRNVYLPPGRWFDISIGLPGTNTQEGLYDALKSNWPSNDYNNNVDNSSASASSSNAHDEFIRERVDKLRKPIDCLDLNGCWLNRQFTPLGSINIYLKGGSIIPTFKYVNHEYSVNKHWKESSIFLEIALNNKQEAFGNLYWDNGETEPDLKLFNKAIFWASNNRLQLTLVEENNSNHTIKLNGFLIYGIDNDTKAKYLNQQYHNKQQQNTTIYKDSKLLYNYDNQTETLSCSFVSNLNKDELRPLELKKYETTYINW